MSCNSVPQECPTRVSYRSIPQECPTRVPHKNFLLECPTRVSRNSVPQECPTRVSRKSVPQEFPTRVTHKSVPQECPTRVSLGHMWLFERVCIRVRGLHLVFHFCYLINSRNTSLFNSFHLIGVLLIFASYVNICQHSFCFLLSSFVIRCQAVFRSPSIDLDKPTVTWVESSLKCLWNKSFF